MALKKAPQTAQNGAGQAENNMNTTEAEAVVKTAHSGTEAAMYGGYTQFVYVGPSLPNGRLKENTVLEGGYPEILQFLGGIVEEYPQVKRLVIPVHRLGEYATKVKTGGNIVNRYYTDIVSAINNKFSELDESNSNAD